MQRNRKGALGARTNSAERDEDYPINLKNEMITEDGGENFRAARTTTRRTMRGGGGRI